MKLRFSPVLSFVLIVTALVLIQVPESEEVEWTWSNVKNRISDKLIPSRQTNAAASITMTYPTPPTAPPRRRTTPTTTARSYTLIPMTTPRRTQVSDQSRTCACGEETASVFFRQGAILGIFLYFIWITFIPWFGKIPTYNLCFAMNDFLICLTTCSELMKNLDLFKERRA
ncbi:hypothetical protein Fcan01_01550 [Folsomia candida]|uniref:Uncharacterized protein n=1 Tax=Folsomia candida TaxID=158441 RepID=A0A226EY52_FOLCA|nr:hypothetical protein Fcan01_01550 [Folsomia candida]